MSAKANETETAVEKLLSKSRSNPFYSYILKQTLRLNKNSCLIFGGLRKDPLGSYSDSIVNICKSNTQIDLSPYFLASIDEETTKQQKQKLAFNYVYMARFQAFQQEHERLKSIVRNSPSDTVFYFEFSPFTPAIFLDRQKNISNKGFIEKEKNYCDVDSLYLDLASVISKENPGYIYDERDIKDWGPFLLCLYALTINPNGRSVIAIPDRYVNSTQHLTAQLELLKGRYIQNVTYLPLSTGFFATSDPLNKGYALFTLEKAAETVGFIDYRLTANGERISPIPGKTPKLENIDNTTIISTEELLYEQKCLSYYQLHLQKNSCGFNKTLGDITYRVPIANSSRKERAGESPVYALSITAFKDGDIDQERLTVAYLNTKRNASCILRPGDIILPRVQRTHIVDVQTIPDKKFDLPLVASINLLVLRLRDTEGLSKAQRQALINTLGFYLKEGHGNKLLAGNTQGSLNWSDLSEIEIPPVLEIDTPNTPNNAKALEGALAELAQCEKNLIDAQNKLKRANKSFSDMLIRADS